MKLDDKMRLIQQQAAVGDYRFSGHAAKEMKAVIQYYSLTRRQGGSQKSRLADNTTALLAGFCTYQGGYG